MRMKRGKADLRGKLGHTVHEFAGTLPIRNHSNMKDKTSSSVTHNQDIPQSVPSNKARCNMVRQGMKPRWSG
jgi:hypothetical protein